MPMAVRKSAMAMAVRDLAKARVSRDSDEKYRVSLNTRSTRRTRKTRRPCASFVASAPMACSKYQGKMAKKSTQFMLCRAKAV